MYSWVDLNVEILDQNINPNQDQELGRNHLSVFLLFLSKS